MGRKQVHLGGDSVCSIKLRLLAKFDFPEAEDIQFSCIKAQDFFEIMVEIVQHMAGLDLVGDWMGCRARAIYNPRNEKIRVAFQGALLGLWFCFFAASFCFSNGETIEVTGEQAAAKAFSELQRAEAAEEKFKLPPHKPFFKKPPPPKIFPPKPFFKPLPPPAPVYKIPPYKKGPPPVPVVEEKPFLKKPIFHPLPKFKKPLPPPIPVYKKPLPPPVPVYKKPFPPPIFKKPIPKFKKPFPPHPFLGKPLPPTVP
ncbi:hypothetical protein ACFX2C_028493 [Malus domestica]